MIIIQTQLQQISVPPLQLVQARSPFKHLPDPRSSKPLCCWLTPCHLQPLALNLVTVRKAAVNSTSLVSKVKAVQVSGLLRCSGTRPQQLTGPIYPCLRMAQEVSDCKAVVFSTVGCPYCKQAKDLLKAEGVSYDDIELSGAADLRLQVKEATGSHTVPQVFIAGQYVGGAAELKAWQKNGKLGQLLAQGSSPALSKDLQEIIALSKARAQAKGGHHSVPLAAASLAQQLHGEQNSADSPQHQAQLYQAFRDLAADMHHPQTGVPRRCHSTGFWKTAKAAFTFQEAVDWLTQHDNQQNSTVLQQLRGKPMEKLSALQQLQLLTAVRPPGADVQALQSSQGQAPLLRLTRDCPWASPGQPLNGHYPWHGRARPAVEVAGSLRIAILDLYERHLAEDGSAVDYKGLWKDSAFANYVDATAELQHVDLAAMSEPERKAFWINLYNMMVIHALATWGSPRSFLQRLSWFGNITYTIGGLDYSTNDVEHGMLRANAPSPASIPVLLGQPQWAAGSLSNDDPRLAFSMKQRDPRIHFALVCGARSCPPIKVYTAENLEEGLDAAASAFCSGDIEIDIAGKEMTMSKIFKWYGLDFGTQVQMLRWLRGYLPEQKRMDLDELLKAPSDVRLSHRPYDWDTNSG